MAWEGAGGKGDSGVLKGLAGCGRLLRMKIEALHIEDPNLLRDIEALAERTGVPAEQAVADAVRAKLGPKDVPPLTREERRLRVDATLARIRALPKVGELLTDAELYDEDGLPK